MHGGMPDVRRRPHGVVNDDVEGYPPSNDGQTAVLDRTMGNDPNQIENLRLIARNLMLLAAFAAIALAVWDGPLSMKETLDLEVQVDYLTLLTSAKGVMLTAGVLIATLLYVTWQVCIAAPSYLEGEDFRRALRVKLYWDHHPGHQLAANAARVLMLPLAILLLFGLQNGG